MKSLTLITGLFLCFPQFSFAKVDLRHCAEFAKNNGTPTNNLSGYADSIRNGKSLRNQENDTFVDSLPGGRKQKTTLKWSKRGNQWVIKQVSLEELKPVKSGGFAGFGQTTVQKPVRRTVTTFAVQNRKCIPRTVEHEVFGKNGSKKITLNTKVCNDIHNFFRKHKNAAKCLNPALTKNLAGFLNKSYGKKSPYTGNSPLQQAYAVRQACKNIPVMDKIVKDKALWKGYPTHKW